MSFSGKPRTKSQLEVATKEEAESQGGASLRRPTDFRPTRYSQRLQKKTPASDFQEVAGRYGELSVLDADFAHGAGGGGGDGGGALPPDCEVAPSL